MLPLWKQIQPSVVKMKEHLVDEVNTLLFTVASVWNTGETGDINTMLCPNTVNSNIIELSVHTFCHWELRLFFC